MSKVIFLVGLPGSGKSTYIEKNFDANKIKIFDDYKNKSIKNIGKFNNSRHFCDLICSLRNGVDCLVADIDFCNLQSRKEAEYFIRELVPQAEIEWRYFENNPVACLNNIYYLFNERSKKIGTKEEKAELLDKVQKKKDALHKYKEIYDIPDSLMPIDIWQIQESEKT